MEAANLGNRGHISLMNDRRWDILDFQVKKLRFEFRWGAILPIGALLLITIVRFGMVDGVAATLLFFASLAAHEAGHAITATLTGTKFSAMGLCLRGAYLRRDRATGALEILISFAGPFMNFMIAMALWSSQGILLWLGQMNAFLFLINLLPLRGSDGQRIIGEIRKMTQLSEGSAT